jgi:hypothetical protein
MVPIPKGHFGDLWRCGACRNLWRIGNICDDCDPRYPGGRCVRGGHHPAGLQWRRALWWQRLVHFRHPPAAEINPTSTMTYSVAVTAVNGKPVTAADAVSITFETQEVSALSFFSPDGTFTAPEAGWYRYGSGGWRKVDD